MFTKETLSFLDEMDLGPAWLLRDTPDPSFDEITQQRLLGKAPVAAQNASVPQGAASQSNSASQPRSAVQLEDAVVPEAFARRPRPFEQRMQPSRYAVSSAAAASSVPASAVIMSPAQVDEIQSADWEALKTIALNCKCCPMVSTRQHVVFGEGEPGPRLVIVGEAPGAEEDLQGVPFVGKSGKLLTAMLDSINVERKSDVVILNVLKCRPPRNRNPEPAEIVCCTHYLMRQLDILKPDLLFLMGRFAAQALLGMAPTDSLGKMRGRVHEAHMGERTAKAVATYHPSYLLRSPDAKAKAWEDLVLLIRTMREVGIDRRAKEKRWI